jgi:sugar phosphate isomerase/epimerase
MAEAVALGFTHVDLVARADRAPGELEALADAGVLVRCLSVGRDLPAGTALDAVDVGARRTAYEVVRRQIDDAAQLGAVCVYLVSPPPGGDLALRAFGEACTQLADHAGQRMMPLCVEPIPGRALGTAGQMLAWLEQLAHPNLALLLDVGHCLISGEDPAALARQAGGRLGYVHLDDNDAVGDLHWPLLTGRLTPRHLDDLAVALREQGYRAGLALELNPGNPDPVAALRESKRIAEMQLIKRTITDELL